MMPNVGLTLLSAVLFSACAQGTMYDTLTLEPLVDNPAMLESLRILRALAAHPLHSARTDGERVTDMSKDRCLVAFGGAEVFKASRSVHA